MLLETNVGASLKPPEAAAGVAMILWTPALCGKERVDKAKEKTKATRKGKQGQKAGVAPVSPGPLRRPWALVPQKTSSATTADGRAIRRPIAGDLVAGRLAKEKGSRLAGLMASSLRSQHQPEQSTLVPWGVGS
eukprot:4150099-Amphidinium_carterae.2